MEENVEITVFSLLHSSSRIKLTYVTKKSHISEKLYRDVILLQY